ncbi:MAG: glycine--tRNA ligase subunit beta, partial [Pseudomonas sp.]
MHDSLLIELLTEELPPRSLKRLSEALAAGVFSSLKDQDFLGADSLCTPFATPRRLAMLITGVADKQADKLIERKGPPLNAALGGSGQPTPALSGFAKSCGVEIKDLQQGTDTKGNPCYVHTFKQKGEKLGTALIAILVNLLPKLPVAKTMRWGDGNALFVRPVHGFLMLHGKKVLKEHLPLLEIKSGQAVTLGHRFLSKGALKIAHADKYEELLESKGKVIAGFAKRKECIRKELEKRAAGARILCDEALLDEVTALVEWPVVYS